MSEQRPKTVEEAVARMHKISNIVESNQATTTWRREREMRAYELRYGKAEQRPRNRNDWEVETAMFFAIARDPLWFIGNGYRFDYRVRVVKDKLGRIIDAYGTADKEVTP